MRSVELYDPIDSGDGPGDKPCSCGGSFFVGMLVAVAVGGTLLVAAKRRADETAQLNKRYDVGDNWKAPRVSIPAKIEPLGAAASKARIFGDEIRVLAAKPEWWARDAAFRAKSGEPPRPEYLAWLKNGGIPPTKVSQ